MESALLLDVVVAQCSTVFELLAGEDEALLIGRNALFVLDFGLDVLDRVTRFHFQGDGLAGKRLHEDLHTTTESEN